MHALILKESSTFTCHELARTEGHIVRWNDDIMVVKFPGYSGSQGYETATFEVVRILGLKHVGILLHVELERIASVPVKNDRKKGISIPEYWINNCESAIESNRNERSLIQADKDEEAHLADTRKGSIYCTTPGDDIDEFGCPDPDCPHWVGRESDYLASVVLREASKGEQSDDSHLISPEDEEYREREAEYRDSVLPEDDTTDEREY